MSSDSQLSFFGRVIPERADVKVSEISLQHRSQWGDYRMNIFIHGSQILVDVPVEDVDEVENIHTLRNLVQSAVSSLTDFLAFLEGLYVSVEIISVIDTEGRKRVFGVKYSPVAKKVDSQDKRDELLTKVVRAYQTEASPYLQRAFTDYRLAMNHAEDTGFYCFRAVESIRQFFYDGNKDKSWKKLREALDVERETIEDRIQKYSKRRRHGDLDSLTAEERNQIIVTTWDILESFIEYASSELDDLYSETDTAQEN